MKKKGYPHSWPKVSRTIRRIAGYRCEWCQRPFGTVYPDGRPVILSVHHIGAAYANGNPGNPHDKHDLRRENLVALCDVCHQQADLSLVRELQHKQRLRKQSKKRQVLVLVPSPAEQEWLWRGSPLQKEAART